MRSASTRVAKVEAGASHEHLPMYLAEFDFRYNARSGLGISDPERAGKLLKGIVGKRLTYRRADETAHA